MPANSAYFWAALITASVATVALIVNVQLAFLIGFFAILAAWTWRNPHQAFYLFIIVAPLLPMFKITQTIGTVTLLKDVIILTLFVKLFLLPLITKCLPYRRNILFGPVMALVVWAAVAAVQADSLVLGILRARDIVLYILFYFVVLYVPIRKQFFREATLWLLISAAIIATLGYYQYFGVADSAVLRFDPARQVWIPRVSSVLAHPSVFGQYLVLISTFLFAQLLVLPRRRLISVLGLLYILPLVYLTFSRAVWLGYVAGFGTIILALMWSWLRQNKQWHVPWKVWTSVSIGLVVALALIIQFTSVGVFVRSAFDPDYASNAARIDFLVRLVAPMNSVQALFGMGLGDVVAQNFREVDIAAGDITSGASRSVQLAKDSTLVDNQYLKTFVEMGLLGLLIYMWLYWRVARNSYLLTTRYSLPTTRIIALWSLGFLAAFVVQAFFIDIWDIFPTNAAFWIIAALVSREQILYTEVDEKDWWQFLISRRKI